MTVHLDQIVPWGRSLAEYRGMFALSDRDLRAGVLDCGGGPASFTAEVAEERGSAIAVDPLYALAGDEIRRRFEASVDTVIAQVRATPEDWSWTFHRDPDALLWSRRTTLSRFLADYEDGRRDGRYLVARLPALPFEDGAFGLALCSHLLFLYSVLLPASFHVRAVRELCRVAREVRIFPLITLGREPSPHLEMVRADLEAHGLTSEVVRVDYELQRGGNRMLRIARESELLSRCEESARTLD